MTTSDLCQGIIFLSVSADDSGLAQLLLIQSNLLLLLLNSGLNLTAEKKKLVVTQKINIRILAHDLALALVA